MTIRYLRLLGQFAWRFLVIYAGTIGMLVLWDVNKTAAGYVLGFLIFVATCAWWAASHPDSGRVSPDE